MMTTVVAVMTAVTMTAMAAGQTVVLDTSTQQSKFESYLDGGGGGGEGGGGETMTSSSSWGRKKNDRRRRGNDDGNDDDGLDRDLGIEEEGGTSG